MRSASSRLEASALLTLLLAACQQPGERTASSPPPSPPRPAFERTLSLKPGAVSEAGLRGGETHSFPFDLVAGQFLRLTVEQQGIDLAVTLRSPDGAPLLQVDSPHGAWGPEPVAAVARNSGRYRLEIRSPGEAAPPGRYVLRVHAVHPAREGDRAFAAAERAFAASEEMRHRDDGESIRSAIAGSRRALVAFRSLGESGREADVLFSLARAHTALGENAAAIPLYREALALFRGLERRREAANTLINLGQAHRAVGEPAEAIPCYEEALALHRRLRERRGEAIAWNDLGRAYAAMGQVEKALSHYEQALAGWRELGRKGDEAATLCNLGSLYRMLGRPRKALDDFERALSIYEGEGRLQDTATTLYEIGWTKRLAGRPREGLAPLQRALRIQRRTGDRWKAAMTLNGLGLLRRDLGQAVEARRCFIQALEIFRDLGDRPGQAVSLTNLADLEILGDPRTAADSFSRAVSLYAGTGDRNGEAVSLFRLARARRRQGDLAAARKAVEDALDRIESLRSEPASYDLRASFLASKQDVHGFYVDLLMEMHRRNPAAGHDAEALAAGEEARARSLLEMLGEAGAGLRREVDPVLLAREADLARRINAAAREKAAEGRELRRLLAEYDRVQAAIRLASPRYAALTRPRPLSLREIQEQVVDGETLLLEYFLGRERSFLWAVTPRALASFELPPRHVLEAAARRAHTLLASSHQTLARTQTEIALAELSRLLLQPAAGLLGRKRLLVVGDGALLYIPFAALPVPGRPGDPAPLVAGREIVTLPSASSLAALRRETSGRRPAPAGIAVVADPVFDSADPRIVWRDQARARPASLRHGLEPGRFGRLPFSRQEAEGILSLEPAAGSLRLLGFAANRDAVLGGALSRYRIVHFATHGVLDADHPELSGIVLSAVDERGRPRDGFLRAHEIYRLSLPADLVVLSACQTALGREIRGEGLVGLTRGFLYAGARRVLVSLWEVEDQATAVLMRRFYEEMLRNGRPPAEALRAAQNALRREKRWEAPYYWAGFVLQGDT